MTHVINILITWAVVLIFAVGPFWLIYYRWQRRKRRRGENVSYGCLPTLLLALLLAAMLYLGGEFVWNVGPADQEAGIHAITLVQKRYGLGDNAPLCNLPKKQFQPDGPNSVSGTYRINYRYEGHTGTVSFHYNKTTGSFDQDVISPDN